MVSNKREWALTGDALDRLLDLLDQDREQAGRKYETFRRKLMAFFEARGSEEPDDHADETIDRVARKITEGEQIDYLDRYIYGVARLVWLESLRARDKPPVPIDLATTAVAPNHEEQQLEHTAKEHTFDCFEACLEELPASQRALIIAYYREESGLKLELRKRQANELNMSLNALRLRASRIRAELSVCIDTCLKGLPKDTKTAIYH